MFLNCYPHAIAEKVTQISVEQLRIWDVGGLVLDIDNTLTTHDNPIPSEGVSAWLAEIRKADIPMIVLSNNSETRVSPFAKLLGLDFLANGKKPLKTGYRLCGKILGVPCEKLCIIGDQLFTDIWGGRRSGCKTILVRPICLEKMPFFRFKRWLEALVMKHCPTKVSTTILSLHHD